MSQIGPIFRNLTMNFSLSIISFLISNEKKMRILPANVKMSMFASPQIVEDFFLDFFYYSVFGNFIFDLCIMCVYSIYHLCIFLTLKSNCFYFCACFVGVSLRMIQLFVSIANVKFIGFNSYFSIKSMATD